MPKITEGLLSKQKPSPLAGVHIRPHATESNVVVIYDKYTALGYVEFENDKSILKWAIPWHGTYLTCKVELPYADLWNDFTPAIAQELAAKFLLS